MNQNLSEKERLANAVAGLAATITEIIDTRIQKLHGSLDGQGISRATISAPVTEGWVDKKAVAKHLQISLRTVQNWMQRRQLPYIKIGGRQVRFKLSQVDAAMDRQFKIPSRWL